MNLSDLMVDSTKTLILVLIWYNFVAVIVNVCYLLTTTSKRKYKLLNTMTVAKSLQAIAFVLIFIRGSVPDIISVNLGNSILISAFFMEALSINEMLINKPVINTKSLAVLLFIMLIFFNAVEFFLPYANIRVASASVSVFAILIVPILSLVLGRESNVFKRVMGLFYFFFVIIMLPRIITMMMNEAASIFTNSIVQSLTFLSLFSVDVLSVSTSIFLMKEDSDNANMLLANTDYLTKLSNRYNFYNVAEEMFESHKQSRQEIVVLFLDLDRFKHINDRYGHQFGDEVLVRFAELVRSNLRECDLACRYGGEEFVVVLPNVNYNVGLSVAKRILNAVNAAVFEEFPDFKFTASIGITGGIPLDANTFAQFIEKADSMLYKAKANGRDRIEGAPFYL